MEIFDKFFKPNIEKMIRALDHKDEDVRRKAAEALGRIGDARAVEPLAKTLKDEDSSVRYCAGGALRALPLERIRNESAVAALTNALDHEDCKVRCNAAHALGRIGDKSAVPALIKALRDTHMEYADDEHPDMGKFHPVSVAAADALGAIGDRSAVPALIEALKHSDRFVKDSAEEALIALGERGDVRAKKALEKIKAKKS